MATSNGIVRLAQFDGKQGLTQSQAISQANQRRVGLLSNKHFDERLNGKEAVWKSEKEVYPAWTGTMVAFAKPGEKLGSTIVYTDPETKQRYTFDAADFKNEKNVILAINHGFMADNQPIFFVKEGKDFAIQINDVSQLKLIENFPKENGWHVAESQFGIPTGSQVNSGRDDARYLYRVDGNYVGLLARGGFDYGSRRVVNAGVQPSYRFGVLASEAGAGAPAAGQIRMPTRSDFDAAILNLRDNGADAAQLSIIQAFAGTKQ